MFGDEDMLEVLLVEVIVGCGGAMNFVLLSSVFKNETPVVLLTPPIYIPSMSSRVA